MAQSVGSPQPKVTFVEHPAPTEHRFRYVSENRTGGPITGVNSTELNKTYPAIKIEHFHGLVIIIISCVTADPPFRPHPNGIVGQEGCKNGVCTVQRQVTETENVFQFRHLCIQRARQGDVKTALKTRASLRVDPFQTGFEFDPESIKYSAVRLAFQVFLVVNGCKNRVALRPLVSNAIYHKLDYPELHINKLFVSSDTIGGGVEIALICNAVDKKNTEVIFYELNKNGDVSWEAPADIVKVYNSATIVCRTPPYNPAGFDPKTHTEHLIQVKIVLQKIPDGTRSNSVNFEYINEGANKKRKVIEPSLINLDMESCTQPHTTHLQFTPSTSEARLNTISLPSTSSECQQQGESMQLSAWGEQIPSLVALSSHTVERGELAPVYSSLSGRQVLDPGAVPEPTSTLRSAPDAQFQHLSQTDAVVTGPVGQQPLQPNLLEGLPACDELYYQRSMHFDDNFNEQDLSEIGSEQQNVDQMLMDIPNDDLYRTPTIDDFDLLFGNISNSFTDNNFH